MPHQHHQFWKVFLITLALASVVVLAAQQVYAQPTPIACPRNQTVILRGANAPPLQGLLVLFTGQPVGGGFSDAAGNWQIPLRTNEPPGIYPVEVQVRASRQVIASLLCYVDVPLPAVATLAPTDTPVSSQPVSQPTPTATATSIATVPRPTQTPTPATRVPSTPTPATQVPSTPTPATRVPSTPTSAAGSTGTPVRVTNTPLPTATTGSTSVVPGRTPTPMPAGLAVTLEIIPYDPNSSASLNEEQVTIRSEEENDLTIAGWRIVNISRPEIPAFVFPAFILQPETDVYLYTGNGTDNLATGDFYWKLNAPVWRRGDVAHLIDAQGRLVSSYEVR
ncbi:lamin tail domain-containing protein [uncultured Chloroflexus sp.]|uniref:lamin tail domain-containing protein n=1 Tax=uncultured Chloroflexus sp. TaxID=214040 RepID=UPI002609CF36|nr:lamin tail domain-containing protein [uncultured Chloroflexus sp.]